jgi:hypothetical protein
VPGRHVPGADSLEVDRVLDPGAEAGQGRRGTGGRGPHGAGVQFTKLHKRRTIF